MEEKIITLVVLSFEKAHILKSLLETEGVECFLENTNLIQGAISTGVKVRISEVHLESAMKVLEGMMQEELEPVEVENIPPRILLPVDFSEYSRKAAEFAMDWAHELEAELTVFHTYFNPIISTMPFSDTFAYEVNTEEMVMELEEKAKEGMEEMKNFLNKKNEQLDKPVSLKMEMVKGIAEDEIIKFSKVYRPLVIIMGTRGADRKATDLIGSVTAEVMEGTKVPVLAIPENFQYSGLGGMKNLLYATDFQEADFRSLEKLEKLIRPLNITVTCGHVSSKEHSQWDEVRMTGLKEHIKKNYNEELVKCDLIEHEDLFVGIEGYVRDNKIDMLSFTRRKRNLINRIINPNLAKKMLFHSTTPLLVFND
ncbi:universal stress protein [Carboxylicivirga sp. A043]|uniref:universal stress protein n=1 Tax=Carboxylicivirga litoralis TaxID=2816963 RepID=UPI0021CB1102|nr:universal stress protein [Carboxylicivirga sp. A043]MCU4158111.1 universal stress protein [Carboxylicivirga sp. A043]